MTNDVALKSTTSLSPWAQAVQASQAERPGKYLLYKKGDWMVGEDEVTEKTLVANPFEIYYGHQRWENKTPGDAQMVRIDQLHLRPRRESLGDNDQEKWPIGPDGKRDDPWVPTVRMILKDPVTAELYVFTSSSWGGRDAIDKFCAAYDKDRFVNEGKMPIVRLASDSYQHKTYGKVLKPMLEIVGWTTWDGEPAAPVDTRAQVKAAVGGDGNFDFSDPGNLPDFTL